MKTTLIIGATPRPSSYANKAMLELEEHGHKTLLYNPLGRAIDDRKIHTEIAQISEPVDTITLYVRPARLQPIVEELIALKPKRIIFNPGTEDADIMQSFKDSEIEALEACTLVMLRTGQY
ncbi:hypothetical protein LNTAR_11001 [Lentisphaera araneosa HTCC2155]|uniref:CoA-binding domain-containing protein n=1 Tax=Lentisphaera araneosa HTCC2155 TaxID=313628 RepID=A6DJ03_9BACT|nr:CoA-binding protein [Lentisphaera araneosa]EDM28439.1 hypothetical protein LNTAR_11001 [Lentisphaera araneosa HTCC2155]